MVRYGGAGGVHFLGAAGHGAIPALVEYVDTICMVVRTGGSIQGIQGSYYKSMRGWCPYIRPQPPYVPSNGLVKDGNWILALSEALSVCRGDT